MTISREQVDKLAVLARLELTDEAAGGLTSDLSKILSYVDKLNELDTNDVPPTAQVTVDVAPMRDDQGRPGVSKQVALEQAPRADEIGFLVPGFVDES